MLIEKTQVKVQGTTESSVSTWIVQSSANINYSIGLANAPTGSTATLGDSLYCDYILPPGLTSGFEVCNITRTYRLVVRLGFLVGNSQVIKSCCIFYVSILMIANFLSRLRPSSKNSSFRCT